MAVSSILSYYFAQTIAALQEVDEVQQERLPDGRVRAVFVTSGIHPDLAKVKTWLWALFAVPVQKVDECTVEELQSGPLIKRYKITVILKPITEGIRRDKSLGLREALLGR